MNDDHSSFAMERRHQKALGRLPRQHRKYDSLLYTMGPAIDRDADCVACTLEMKKDVIVLRHVTCQNSMCCSCFERALPDRLDEEYKIAKCPFCRADLLMEFPGPSRNGFLPDSEITYMYDMPLVAQDTILKLWDIGRNHAVETGPYTKEYKWDDDADTSWTSVAFTFEKHPGNAARAYEPFVKAATLRYNVPRTPRMLEFLRIASWRGVITMVEDMSESDYSNGISDDLIEMVMDPDNAIYDEDVEVGGDLGRDLSREYYAAYLATLYGTVRFDRRLELALRFFIVRASGFSSP